MSDSTVEVEKCQDCPLAYVEVTWSDDWFMCTAVHDLERTPSGPPPNWCPLRRGAVTVRLKVVE